jgi:lysozyme family protein
MRANFIHAFDFTTSDAIEGGFSDNPDDPGGATMRGITLAEFREFYHNPQLSIDDLKNITVPQQEEIYEKAYWQAVSADLLPAGVDLSVFDMGVNAGVGTSIRQLQKAVDATIDGIIGPVTLHLVDTSYDIAILVNLWSVQTAYYRALRGFEEFGQGWLKRAAWRLQAALALVDGVPTS